MRNRQTEGSCAILHSRRQRIGVPVASHPCQPLAMSVFLVLAIPVDVFVVPHGFHVQFHSDLWCRTSFYMLYWTFVYLLWWGFCSDLFIFQLGHLFFCCWFLKRVLGSFGQHSCIRYVSQAVACFLFLLILPPSTSNNYPLVFPAVIIDVPFHFHLELVWFACNVSWASSLQFSRIIAYFSTCM